MILKSHKLFTDDAAVLISHENFDALNQTANGLMSKLYE